MLTPTRCATLGKSVLSGSSAGTASQRRWELTRRLVLGGPGTGTGRGRRRGEPGTPCPQLFRQLPLHPPDGRLHCAGLDGESRLVPPGDAKDLTRSLRSAGLAPTLRGARYA